jgi:type I restriction enzyme M protein
MAYWEETMQDDVHIITADGWGAGNEVLRQFKETKKKDGTSSKKEITGLYGLEGRLIPVELLIKIYFAAEQRQLEELNSKLEEVSLQMDELKDEHGGEEGLLSDVIENDKIKKADVQRRIKEIKDDADYVDELKVLKQCADLFEEEAETKKQIKEVEEDLERKVIAKYPALTLEEIKSLVVESKLMDEIGTLIMAEVDQLSQKLAGRVKELAERYSKPLPKIEREVEDLTKKVEGHLAKIGFKLG